MRADTAIIDFNLYLITDRLLAQAKGKTLVHVVEEALAGGVKAVQLREKDLTSRELYELAYELRKLTARYDCKLFINDRIDITMAVEADGVHLGTNSMPIYKARKILGESKAIGVSCHNQVTAITAQEKGADFITFGPVFFTPSKASYGAPLGLEKFEQVTELLQIPVFALGGISCGNAPEVIQRGAHGIALISAIIAAEDPREAAKSILATLRSSSAKG